MLRSNVGNHIENEAIWSGQQTDIINLYIYITIYIVLSSNLTINKVIKLSFYQYI